VRIEESPDEQRNALPVRATQPGMKHSIKEIFVKYFRFNFDAVGMCASRQMEVINFSE